MYIAELKPVVSHKLNPVGKEMEWESSAVILLPSISRKTCLRCGFESLCVGPVHLTSHTLSVGSDQHHVVLQWKKLYRRWF